MNEPFFRHLSLVTIVHVSVVALLVFATFFQGCILPRDREELVPFTVDVIPTQEGPVGQDPEAVLPEPEPEPVIKPEPTVALEPVKQPVKEPAKQPDKPPVKIQKEPIQKSTVKVVRDVKKGNVSHYNPLSAKEIERLLERGGERSNHTSIPGEDQRQKLLVRKVLYESWVPPSKADAGNAVTMVRLWFGDGGRITKWQMERRSNVAVLDDSVARLLESVRQVPGLSQNFINQYRLRGFTAEFKVEE